MKIDDNPYEKWDIDPRDDVKRITRTMRRRLRDLSPEDREALRDDWRALTDDITLRAHWIALTPPPLGPLRQSDDPWELAEQLLQNPPDPTLPRLRPTLADALVLPLLRETGLYAPPPFLPAILRHGHDKERP